MESEIDSTRRCSGLAVFIENTESSNGVNHIPRPNPQDIPLLIPSPPRILRVLLAWRWKSARARAHRGQHHAATLRARSGRAPSDPPTVIRYGWARRRFELAAIASVCSYTRALVRTRPLLAIRPRAHSHLLARTVRGSLARALFFLVISPDRLVADLGLSQVGNRRERLSRTSRFSLLQCHKRSDTTLGRTARTRRPPRSASAWQDHCADRFLARALVQPAEARRVLGGPRNRSGRPAGRPWSTPSTSFLVVCSPQCARCTLELSGSRSERASPAGAAARLRGIEHAGVEVAPIICACARGAPGTQGPSCADAFGILPWHRRVGEKNWVVAVDARKNNGSTNTASHRDRERRWPGPESTRTFWFWRPLAASAFAIED